MDRSEIAKNVNNTIKLLIKDVGAYISLSDDFYQRDAYLLSTLVKLSNENRLVEFEVKSKSKLKKENIKYKFVDNNNKDESVDPYDLL